MASTAQVISQQVPGPVSLSETGETGVVSSGQVAATGKEDTIFVVAWAHVQAGPGARSITPRLRRGSGVSGAVAFTGRAVHAGGKKVTRDVVFLAHHERKGTMPTDGYTLTLEQAGGTGPGSATDAGVTVYALE